MYPIKLGYSTALARINALTTDGHYAEALVTSAFTAEKTLRRTLRQIVISAGFPSRIADKIIGGLRGLEAIKNAWEIYDPKHRRLADLLAPTDWKALKMRRRCATSWFTVSVYIQLQRTSKQSPAFL